MFVGGGLDTAAIHVYLSTYLSVCLCKYFSSTHITIILIIVVALLFLLLMLFSLLLFHALEFPIVHLLSHMIVVNIQLM